MIRVNEKNLGDIKLRFDALNTDLTKMEYLESVLKISDITMDVKKFVFINLAEMYDRRMMYDKAAKAMYGKAGFDSTFREKVDSLLKAGEYFVKGGNIVSADDMFLRALREGNTEQQAKINLARKNIFMAVASDLEKKQRMANAAKFYEHILTFKLDELEKTLIKKKLSEYYKRVGRFVDAKTVEAR